MFNTVLGPRSRAECGIISPHEHVFIDISNQFSEPGPAAFAPETRRTGATERVCLQNLSALKRNPYVVKDNLRIMDMETAVAELDYYRFYGGGTVVDQTPIGVGRDVRRLAEVSRRTGVHIIASTSLYTADAIPQEFDRMDAHQIAERFIRELTVGIDDTDIPAGLIGEIGTGFPVTDSEWKSLEAAAIAHRHTGVPISVHTYPWGEAGLDILDFLKARGVSENRVCICHVDVQPNMDYIEALLRRGAYVEFDDFGKEFHMTETNGGFGGGAFASDYERVGAIAKLVAQGYAGQILLSNDVCLKVLLHAYGGFGYDHVLRDAVPMMERMNIPKDAIERIVRLNPADFLEPDRQCDNK